MKRKLITYSFLAVLILNNLVFLHAGKSYADVTDGPEIVPVSMDKSISTYEGNSEYYPDEDANWVGSDSFGDSKSALQFDLSSYTGTFSKALLKIYITETQSVSGSGAASVNVWGSNQDSWKEGEFPTQDTLINEDHSDFNPVVGDYVYLDVTSFVNQKMLENKKVSLILTGQTDSYNSFAFASDNNPHKAVLELTPMSALDIFNHAKTIDEMQAAMETNPLYAFDTEQSSQSFFSDVKNDKRYVYQYMLDHRPEGGFTNQEEVQGICGDGVEKRSPYMNLHESRDPMMIDFSLMMPDDFDFGIDLSYLASFMKDDSDFSEVDEILSKLIIPEDGFVGPDDLQAAINECIHAYLTESVEADKQALKVTYADGDDESHVTQHLVLPTSGNNGTEISWASSDPQYVSANGTVTRPSNSEEGKEVTLTATIKRDSQSSTKTFTIQVLPLEQSSYTVYFNSNKGSDVPAVMAKENETITKPEDPTKEGYTFAGWFTDEDLTTPFDFSKGIQSNITLYANWKKQRYTVSFDTDGGSAIQNQLVNDGDVVAQPQTPEKEGYEFAGWYSSNSYTTPFDFNQDIHSNTTVYAKWKIKSYIVSFNTDGGSAISNQEVHFGDKATQPQTPEKEGYEFAGWYTDSSYKTPYDFDQDIHLDVTVYAKWQKQSYTVSFDTDGGSMVPNQVVNGGDVATQPENPVKEGYEFAGWYTDDVMFTPFDFSQKIQSNVSLKAKWVKQTYVVHFIGAVNIPDQSVEYGGKATMPNAPTNGGYTFDGWYTGLNYLTPYDFNQPVKSNLDLFAMWQVNSYTVHFDTDGGNQVSDQLVNFNGKASEPADPTKTGYTFKGWYKDKTLQTAYDFDQEITKNTTLYAKWQSNDATLGSLPLSGDAVLSPAFDPSKEDYTVNVGNNVDSITVAPTTANDHATMTVNGQISSANIHLNVGKNEVTIVVTAQDGTTRTYTITVNRAASTPPPVPTNTPSDGSTRQVDVTVGQDGNGTAATVEITRKIENGVKVDEVTFNESKAQEVVQKAIAQNKDISTIVLTDLPQDVADEMKVNVLQKAFSQLGNHHIALQIETPSATVSLPKETVQSLNEQGNDLYFRVAPIRKEDEQQKVIQETLSSNTVKQAVGENTKDIQVYGNPITIETNYKDYKTDVLFPLKNIDLPSDPVARNAFLNTLRVYVKHTDGTEEFLKGDIVKDSSGNPVSLKIQISKFSTFTVLGVPQTAANHAPVASHVAISGSKTVGSVLKGTYTYSDADRDPQGKTVYRWYRADNSKGLHKQIIKGAVQSTYTLTENDKGKYISFEVVPVATGGNQTGKPADSSFVGKIVAKNSAPTVSGVKISGDATVGKSLHVSYKYYDADGDKQGKTIIKWYRVDKNKKKLIKGATKSTYTVTTQDESKRIVVEVTPVAKSGIKTGAKKTSSASKIVKVQYNGHLKLGVIRSKSYIERMGSIIRSDYHGQVSVKKSGSYYKLSANFKTKAEATKAGKDLKQRKLIINYSIH